MVDEFQDTDPLQIEILWLICGEDCKGSDALARPLRPGGLFMMGDPKQAIYRFRGADVNAFRIAGEVFLGQFSGGRMLSGELLANEGVSGHSGGRQAIISTSASALAANGPT
jgi:ATP-dependent exoDNAse (exonuclease V) beta subunit